MFGHLKMLPFQWIFIRIFYFGAVDNLFQSRCSASVCMREELHNVTMQKGGFFITWQLNIIHLYKTNQHSIQSHWVQLISLLTFWNKQRDVATVQIPGNYLWHYAVIHLQHWGDVSSSSISWGNSFQWFTKNILRTFHYSFIESIFTFSMSCWFHSVTLQDRSHLQSAVKVCSEKIGLPVSTLSTFCEQHSQRIPQDSSHTPTHPSPPARQTISVILHLIHILFTYLFIFIVCFYNLLFLLCCCL